MYRRKAVREEPSPAEPDFAWALAAARRGDQAGLGVIWRRHHPVILRYLRAMEPRAAEDVASETWLSAARGLRAFEGDETALRAWLLTIARRRLADHRRHEGRHPATPVEQAELERESGAPGPEAAAIERSSTDEALALLASIPRDQAEAVALRTIAGLSVEDTAEIMGKRPGTVRVLAHRGLRSLAALLGDPDRAKV